jgi:hypothetical protein
MRKLFIIAVILGTVFSSFAQPCNSKAKFAETINSILEKPSVFLSNKNLYIIHPMIKKEEREREYKLKGNFSWEGDSCKIVYTSYEQTKGPESKSTIKLRETLRYTYPINTLKTFLAENKFKGWDFAESLELDKQQFSGYKSTVVVDGVEKDFKVYLKDNQLYAASCGFAKAGISHEDKVEESADFWYFEKAEGKLRLVKKFTIEASKNNSVPFLTKTTNNYQY